MKGKRIVVTDLPRGRMDRFIVNTSETWYPGTVVQIDPTQTRQGACWVGKLCDISADGAGFSGACFIVTEEGLATYGKGITSATSFDSYAAGQLASVYAPQNGDELNLLFKNVSGTADDVVAGDLMIVDDTTGKFIVTTGSPTVKPAMALEAVTDPTADTLFWASWGGFAA